MREVLFMRRMVVAALLAALLLSLVPAARADSTSATASTEGSFTMASMLLTL